MTTITLVIITIQVIDYFWVNDKYLFMMNIRIANNELLKMDTGFDGLSRISLRTAFQNGNSTRESVESEMLTGPDLGK